ncbi:MAG: type II toxin-antitoxin system VapC family toxin [Acidimicrobiaceae bacterium]|nr:type II toxin-antitoxin system VapC family toxin [Acidimicrobiaceae bacterium]MYD06992.1 type II toxin-antitoxin system VapC family toxin [Acidimicrobiaceae bacterium]MYI58310.1 type II toxin-antitoxin system VapC family toxin [Acidimicrobiaceae bacterium]
MIVVDASVLSNSLADDGLDGAEARNALSQAGEAAVPDLADVETAAVLRKRWMAQTITDDRFSTAIDILAGLPFRRYPISLFLRRAYELRSNITAYDAVYVALAEALDCELVTCDARLARASGARCHIRVLRG